MEQVGTGGRTVARDIGAHARVDGDGGWWGGGEWFGWGVGRGMVEAESPGSKWVDCGRVGEVVELDLYFFLHYWHCPCERYTSW